MLAEERKARIVDFVNSHGAAMLSELSELLGASESTVRRDVESLSQAGLIMRVHGGATKLSPSNLVLVDQASSERRTLNAAQKDAVGRLAASLIGPDDFVYLDAGTTTAALVEHLSETRATFMTNSLPIAQRLLQRGCRALVPAGELKPVTEAIVGEVAVESLRSYNFTIGFFGTNGADVRTGFTTPELSEASVKRCALEHTLHPIVLCDASKFSKVSLVTFADFGSASIICDHAPDDVRAAMAEAQQRKATIELVEVA